MILSSIILRQNKVNIVIKICKVTVDNVTEGEIGSWRNWSMDNVPEVRNPVGFVVFSYARITLEMVGLNLFSIPSSYGLNNKVL